MKLRYYMRGLGIGMVVTALVMGIATKDSLPLTDAEIKAKALTLGMVEEDSLRLSDIQQTPASSQEPAEDGGNLPSDTGEGYEDSGEDTESSVHSDEPGTEDPQETEMITIQIESGAGSYLICQQLEELGLVEDAWEFDKYLIDNGFSKRVHAGTHEIPVGADWDQIIKIITKTGN